MRMHRNPLAVVDWVISLVPALAILKVTAALLRTTLLAVAALVISSEGRASLWTYKMMQSVGSLAPLASVGTCTLLDEEALPTLPRCTSPRLSTRSTITTTSMRATDVVVLVTSFATRKILLVMIVKHTRHHHLLNFIHP